jgi:hypothetical protein
MAREGTTELRGAREEARAKAQGGPPGVEGDRIGLKDRVEIGEWGGASKGNPSSSKTT